MSVFERPGWFPNWSGDVCVIVASGPSAKSVDLARARGKARFIVVNDSWQLAPWADILYACDYQWWEKWGGCPQFGGMKVTIDYQASQDFKIRQVYCNRVDDRINLENDGDIGWGGNSGFGALNIAAKLGSRHICLVGYDHTIENGKHWHPDHPAGMHNPTQKDIYRWRNPIEAAAEILSKNGIKVWNCSMISALRKFEKRPFEELFLAEDGCPAHTDT